jgi:phosphate transport system substrate-binding protein
MLQALAEDPAGIGYAGLLYKHSEVRPLALADHGGRRFVAPTLETVRDHSYPLTRMITMYLDRAPRRSVAPTIAEFMRYVLAREGQLAVLSDGQGYLPILRPFARRELAKLG